MEGLDGGCAAMESMDSGYGAAERIVGGLCHDRRSMDGDYAATDRID